MMEAAAAKMVIGIGDMAVSGDPTAQLTTYALGSCLGIAVYDPMACVGGLLHVMLPSSSVDASGAAARPYRFVDTGVPLLFRACYKLGAVKSRLVVSVAGGSAAAVGEDGFQIGKRNIVALRQLLWKNGVLIHAQDVGGISQSRTMTLDLSSGRAWVRVGGDVREL
jgi:chemotaxis protein CheD